VILTTLPAPASVISPPRRLPSASLIPVPERTHS
jgi:hypothetical protein